MLSALLRFEVQYHYRQITFKIAALLFFGLGMLSGQGNFGGTEVHVNAPYVITYIVGLLSLFTIFASTLFCANVVLRDTNHGVDQVIFTTAVARLPYFSVRFAGLLLAVFLVLCLAVAGILAGSLLSDSTRAGDFYPAYFLQPLFILGLPNVLFVSSLIFCTAMLTRNVRAIYTAGVLLYILYSVAAILGNSPLFASSALKTGTPDLLPLLTDPFGLAIFLGDTRSWSVLQRNEQLYPLQGILLQNRLLWTVFSLLILSVTYKFFPFRLPSPVKTRPSKTARVVAPIPYLRYPVRPEGIAYTWNTFWSQFKLETISVFKHIPFLVMILLWIFVFSIELRDTMFSGAYGIRFYPTTGMIVEALRSIKPAMLLVIFYAAELAGRERTTNIQSLLYSTPVPNAVMWAAKCATLGVLIAMLVTANIGIGISLQLSNGYFHFQVPIYLSLFYYSGLPLFLFAILTLLIQTLTPNKYLGMLLNFGVAALILFSQRMGIEHYLLRFATVPDMNYSDMNGFGHYTKAFHLYMVYWTAFAAIIALLTIGLWQRSQYMTRRFHIKPGLAWLAPIVLFISTGAIIYYKTNTEGHYKSSRSALDWRVGYEQKYKSQAALPQPDIIAVKTAVDLYPEEGRYTVKGTYHLRNNTSTPISRIWVGVDPEVSSCNVSLPNAARRTQDAVFHQYWYELKAPLLPGAQTALQFSMEVVRSGFTTFNKEHAVVANGTYIELEKYVPFLGYNERLETDDPGTRKARGLSRQQLSTVYDSAYHLIDLETTVSTAPDQHVVTVGTLQRSWSDKGRNYFSYKTTVPINFMFALSSAKYAIKKEAYKGILFSVLYQPGQTNNTDAIMQAMKDAVDYCTQHFGPYPLKHLTLAEIPQYRGAATAYPGVIFSAENINFLGNFSDSGKINYAYGIVAHEVAHQWWANKLAPAALPGSPFLTETLAQYSEAMIMEKAIGKRAMRNYLKAENQLYFSMQYGDETEQALAHSTEQSFVYYQKGSLAMYALKEALGEDRINHALQQLLDKHAYPGARATADDLIRILNQDASPAEIRLIRDCLRGVIVYSLKMEVLSSSQLANGQHSVQLRVHINKTDAGKPIAPDDDIDIAVFAQQPDNWSKAIQPIYLQKHHFSKGMTELSILLNQAPASVGIDPYCYLPDANQLDNIAVIK